MLAIVGMCKAPLAYARDRLEEEEPLSVIHVLGLKLDKDRLRIDANMNQGASHCFCEKFSSFLQKFDNPCGLLQLRTYPWGAVLSLAYALTLGGESPQRSGLHQQ